MSHSQKIRFNEDLRQTFRQMKIRSTRVRVEIFWLTNQLCCLNWACDRRFVQWHAEELRDNDIIAIFVEMWGEKSNLYLCFLCVLTLFWQINCHQNTSGGSWREILWVSQYPLTHQDNENKNCFEKRYVLKLKLLEAQINEREVSYFENVIKFSCIYKSQQWSSHSGSLS